MKIRRATLADTEMIANQNIALAKESENMTLDQETVLAGVHAVLSDEKKGFYVVAEQDAQVIGQVMVTVEWSDWRNKPLWWIQSVYVQSNWRHKNVFTQLMAFIRKQALQQHVAFLRLYVHKHNRLAIDVYRKNGWDQAPYLFYQSRL